MSDSGMQHGHGHGYGQAPPGGHPHHAYPPHRGTHDQDEDDTVMIPVGLPDSASSYDKMRTPSGSDTPSAQRPVSHGGSGAAGSQHGGSGGGGGGGGGQEDEDDHAEDLMHGINSFWALAGPVCLTMLIASFVVVNYRNASIEASMQTYLVFGNAEQSGGGAEQVGLSLVNALVIILAIAILTFGMALLYKFNCMKFLTGYIMFASTAILSFVGGQLVDSVVNDQLQWTVDWPSFLYIMINFGVVGVISIFYQQGTPKVVQNGYLVLVSVILAWEFSMWPMWTTFTFCVMFAVYDLCAVLTPCGPLKCLIGLIQDKQAPLPGLIYEADIRDGVNNNRNRRPPQDKNRSSSGASTASGASNGSRPQEPRREQPNRAVQRPQPPPVPTQHQQSHEPQQSGHHAQPQRIAQPPPAAAAAPAPAPATFPDGTSRPRTVAESDFTTYECESLEKLIALLEEFYRVFSPEDTWKAPQVAEKFFPTQERLWLLIFHKYMVCSCAMEIPCPVQARQQARQRRQEEEEEDKTIKLGLGDFIFYSVLVGRAAIYDFSTFVVAFLCIVLGLGGTLFLLSVLHKSLPALPVSIFLATAFYFWTSYIFVDFCDFLMVMPAAV